MQTLKMNKPIIDPSTLSEEQREAIREEYRGWAVFLNTNDDYAARIAIAAINEIFGSEFFEGLISIKTI